MKVKKKGGKVFPSPSSVNGRGGGGGRGDVLSVLKLLPATILAIVSILCFEDREVLAYMITRSVNATSFSPSSVLPKNSTKKSNNKSKNNQSAGGGGGGSVKGHRPPIFECDCFDCYANYWYRWNSSPNRDLIQEAIEAFEEHLSANEKSARKSAKSGKQIRVKANRPNVEKPPVSPLHETDDKPRSPLPADNVLSPPTSSSKTLVTGSASMSTHRGFARKVLPDLFGLLNSRLWNRNA